MAAPGSPLQVCVLVSYPHGFAHSLAVPTIGVFALVDPADESDPGIVMRVERCTGAACSGFVSRGTGNVMYVGSGAPQAEFADTGAYGTIYRYRVRMENNDGNSAYSAEIEIDTTIHGTSACTTGTISDLGSEVREFGVVGIVEYHVAEVQEFGLIGILEYYGDPADMPPDGDGNTEPGGAGPGSGPDPDRFPGPNPPPYTDNPGNNRNVFIYYGHKWEFLKDPLDVTRHDSYELDFGWPRWKFIRRLWLAGQSQGAVTVQIFIDEVLKHSFNITFNTSSGTGWERHMVVLPPNLKGQLFRFVMTADSAFKIWVEHSAIEWHPLSGDRGYQKALFLVASPSEPSR